MGTGLPPVIELILVLLFFGGGSILLAWPLLLAGWADGRRAKFERDLIVQAEIARKVAIAEAANEARKRGEKFVPPADYDRSV